MAEGPVMLRAVRNAIKQLPAGSEFKINRFDAYDLMKLRASQLSEELGCDESAAEAISADLMQGNLLELGRALGVNLTVDKSRPNLIPGSGIVRTAGALATDPQPLSEMF